MKISKKQLRSIIREERSRLLSEQGGWGDEVETGSDLITFAKAYAGLGGAVQDQVDAIVAAYFNSGGSEDPRFEDVVYEQNPNAIDMAVNRLGSALSMLDMLDDAIGIQEALDAAMEIASR